VVWTSSSSSPPASAAARTSNPASPNRAAVTVIVESFTWTERHEAIAPRATLTERARAWAFEQVGRHDAAVLRTAKVLGVAWWTVMRQVIERGTPQVEDPARLEGVAAVGVDETAFLRANATRSTTFATGIADLSPGRPARLLDVVEGRSGSVLAAWLADRDSAWRAGVSTARGHSPGPSHPGIRVGEAAVLASPAIVLSARLDRYYDRRRLHAACSQHCSCSPAPRPTPGSPSTSWSSSSRCTTVFLPQPSNLDGSNVVCFTPRRRFSKTVTP
jgi:hypothetical protein